MKNKQIKTFIFKITTITELTNFADRDGWRGDPPTGTLLEAWSMVLTGWVMVAPHHLGPGPLCVHAAGTRGVARGEVVQPDVGQLLRPPGLHGEQNAVDQSKVPLNILLEVKTLVCIHVVSQWVVGWNVPDLHSVFSAVEV